MDSVRVDDAVAIVMAAGKSTRMKSNKPKVLHELCGRPILQYILDALHQVGVRRKLVVVGFQAELVKEAFAREPGVEFVLQSEQLGTGHAVMMAEPLLRDHRGPVVVIAGDQPMIRPQLVADMLRRLRETEAQALLATAIVPNPFGLGRILRDSHGEFVGIIEQKDTSTEQSRINEINPSFYAFDGSLLFSSLRKVRPENAQKEYYLTDVPAILRRDGYRIVADVLATETDMYGINHRGHLAEAHRLMQERIIQRHFDEGVTIVDPRSTYIDVRAQIGNETVIHPNTVIEGPVTVGKHCNIGPFAYLGPGAVLADNATVGSFQSVVGKS
jgi:bifunctional UDP-N-acetylglucosamine pyrophosphorylase/glucosamine-1-phosphate N-acetyltransferase